MAALTNSILAELIATHGKTCTSKDLMAYGQAVYWNAANGGLKRAGRGVYILPTSIEGTDDFEAKEAVQKLSPQEMSALIAERFKVLEILGNGIISGHINSLVVSGAAGVGKTYTLDAMLQKALLSNKIKSVKLIKGSVSAVALYATLHENAQKGQVLVLDDTDEIFSDEETMNILKAALDTGKTRVMSWVKDSTFLESRGVPDTFEYEGQVVFITNKDLESIVERQQRLAPHVAALLSRSTFLDLAIHTNDQIIIRIEQVLESSDMIRQMKVSNAQALELLGWVKKNLTNMRVISLRTMLQLATFMSTTEDWQLVARTTLLKKSF